MNYLIVIDMQNDFVTGSLGSTEARMIVQNVVKRIEKAKADGWNIICTKDTHNDDYLNTPEGKKLPVPHCIAGTEGHDICADVLKALPEGTTIYEKPIFGSTAMVADIVFEIQEREIEERDASIELVGLCTDICVVSNAILLKTFLPSANISVNASCCAGVTPELHEAALKVMKSCQIDIIEGDA